MRNRAPGSSRPADEERRRIERDLHDGAQQRLVALALQLRSAQRRMGTAPTRRSSDCWRRPSNELQVAVEELSELARGIHPAILTEGGLAAALESLVSQDVLSRSTWTPRGTPAGTGRGDRLLRGLRGTRECRQARPSVEGERSDGAPETGCSSSRSRTTESAARTLRTAPGCGPRRSRRSTRWELARREPSRQAERE